MRISDWISDVCSSDLFSISTSPPAIRLAQGWGRRAWSTASWCRATRRTERRGGFMTAGSATQRIEPQPWMTAPETRAVIAALTAAGAEVRFVGGCVRDALAGRAVKDVDIATPDRPEQVIDRKSPRLNSSH